MTNAAQRRLRLVFAGLLACAACGTTDSSDSLQRFNRASPGTTQAPTSTPPGADGAVSVLDSGRADQGGTGVDVSTTKGCDAGGFLFCEDFDKLPQGEAKSSKWTNDIANGSLTIDATKSRRGNSVKVHTNGDGRALMRVSGLTPTGNSLFGRMYAWVTAFPSAPNYAHYTLVEAAGTGSGTVVRPIGGQYVMERGAKKMWGVGSDGGPTGDWTRWQETAVSEPQKWLCLEWELDATDNAVRVWIDGVAKPELSVSTKVHGGDRPDDFVFPKFDRIFFGFWLYQQNPTPAEFDMWLDDIALAQTRIGCGNPT